MKRKDLKRSIGLSAVILVAGGIGNALAQSEGAESTATDPSVPAAQASANPVDAATATSGTASGPEALPIQSAGEQTQDTARPKSGSSSRVIEEIVVTATKREENLQSVPISISAFSGEKLDALGVQSAEQLPKITPGLTFSSSAGYTQVYLRGVGSDAFLPSADPDVPIYLDGVALLAGHGVSGTLGRVSRVEVLKGPQGTLFGRNSTGGAISIITPDPTAEFGGDVQTEFGNYGNFNTLAFVNLPIYGGLGATISGYDEQHDPYQVNDAGPTVDSYSRGGRAKLLWHATEDLSFNLSASYGEQSSNFGTAAENTRVAPDFRLLIPQDPKLDRHYSENVLAGSVSYSTLYAGGADWKLPWVELKTILSDQRERNTYEAYDYDASVMPLVSFDSTDEFFNQATAELQILSTPDTPLSKYFSWVAGGYYLEGNGGFPDLVLRVANGAQTAGILSAIPGTAGFINSVNGVLAGVGLGPLVGITGPVNLVSGGLLSSRSLSGYFQGTVHLADTFNLPQEFNLILGARLDRESRGLAENRLAVVDPLTASGRQITALNFHVPKVSAVQVPLKIGLQYYPIEATQVYATFGRGFTAPTYSTVNFFKAPPPLQPQKVNSYELGVKTQLFDRALTLNAAAFYIKEFQLLSGFASLTSGGVVNFDNVPAGRIRGVEADFTLAPFQELDPGLVLLGSASYLDAKYTKYPNGRGYDPKTGLSFGPSLFGLFDGKDFSGNDIDRTPHFSYNIGINQSFAIGDDSRVEFNVATNYSDGYFFDAQNAPEYAVGSFQLFDASANYFYAPWGIEVTAFGKNLTQKTYSTSVFVLDTGAQRTANDPRTYGLRLKYTF